MTPRSTTRRELGRATLARQLLLERVAMDPLDAVRHLAGLQAQTAQTWYGALQSRLIDFDPLVLSDALEQRRVVRATLMRGTIHLVSAEDALEWEPLLHPVVERVISGAFRKALDGLDLDEAIAEGRRLLAAGPMTAAELGRGLQVRWPDRDRLALSMAIRRADPLIQATPRGLWQRSGQAKLAPLESWLGASMNPKPSVDALVLRYLVAFGPASVMDAQAWSGLTRLREVFERLRPGLIVLKDEDGRELFDLPDAPRPASRHAGSGAMPVRLRQPAAVARRPQQIRHGELLRVGLDHGRPATELPAHRRHRRWYLATRPDEVDGRARGPHLRARSGSRSSGDLESEGAALLEFWAPALTHDIRVERATRP